MYPECSMAISWSHHPLLSPWEPVSRRLESEVQRDLNPGILINDMRHQNCSARCLPHIDILWYVVKKKWRENIKIFVKLYGYLSNKNDSLKQLQSSFLFRDAIKPTTEWFPVTSHCSLSGAHSILCMFTSVHVTSCMQTTCAYRSIWLSG